MANPTDRKYSKDHTWAKIAGTTAEVGVTDYAQRQLKEIVFVDLPKKGVKIQAGKAAGGVESVKSVSDIKSPLSGEILEVNTSLESSPGSINKDPYKAWVFKLKVDPKEAASLMDAKTYESKYK